MTINIMPFVFQAAFRTGKATVVEQSPGRRFSVRRASTLKRESIRYFTTSSLLRSKVEVFIPTIRVQIGIRVKIRIGQRRGIRRRFFDHCVKEYHLFILVMLSEEYVALAQALSPNQGVNFTLRVKIRWEKGSYSKEIHDLCAKENHLFRYVMQKQEIQSKLRDDFTH